MFLSLVLLSFIPLVLFLVSLFHLFCLSVFTLLFLFCSMSGTQRGTDQIVTLVWILSGTMSTTFRRTRRRTYITMAQQENDESFFVSRASKVGVTARKLRPHIVLCRQFATAMMSGDRMCSFLSRAQCTQQICDRSFKEKRRVKQANNTAWRRGS